MSDEQLVVDNVAHLRATPDASALRVSREHYLWLAGHCENVGWLIEAGWEGRGATDYWCGCFDPWKDSDGLERDLTITCAPYPYGLWTKDPAMAVRFVRKCDAEAVARTIHYNAKPRVAEHSWDMVIVRGNVAATPAA